MKIVIIPGVGYQSDNEPLKYLGNKIKEKYSCDYEIFNWDHTPIKEELEIAMLANKIKTTNEMSYIELRSFVTEVILDFEYALKYGGIIDVTEADYYIGHSAGSLFAMAQDKPCTIMGSPIALVRYLPKSNNPYNLFVNTIFDNDKSILNLINKHDVVAYPLNDPEVKNVYFSGNFFNPLAYFPLTAHSSYWKSKFVIDEIVKHLKSISYKEIDC